MARGAGASLLARIGYKHLVLAIRTAHPGKTFVEIPALEKSRYRAVNNRTPEAVLGLESLAINLPKGLEMPNQQAPQIRGLGIARLIQGQRFETGQAHEATLHPDNQNLSRGYTFKQVDNQYMSN